jgi:pimeloyl-ACP methyl ester carboxylesterase
MSKTHAILFLHGLGGSANEAAYYRPFFADSEVVGLDYNSIAPWEAGNEIKDAVQALCAQYESVGLIGYSLGAYLAMHAGIDAMLERAYFISPVVDMEAQIRMLMAQEGVTEEALKAQSVIPTGTGVALSWDYLCWVRTHPVQWSVPTEILYANGDILTPYETIAAFAKAHGATLTVMEHGEHWFHTDEQLRFLNGWLQAVPKQE